MQGTDVRAALVQEKLLLNKDKIFEETVLKSARVVRLDEGGGIHPTLDTSSMGAKLKVELFLLGRYLAHEGKLTQQDSARDEEVARFFGLPVHEVQKRAHDLRVAGRIQVVKPGEYKLTEGRVNEVLKDLGVD